MLEHCNRTFRADEIWFLNSNSDFTHRKLEIGKCPECEQRIAKLTEKRVTDGRTFKTVYTKKRADKVIRECKTDVQYKSSDIEKFKGNPYGFKYGENRERINKKTGEITRIEVACDFYGAKETIRQYKA